MKKLILALLLCFTAAPAAQAGEVYDRVMESGTLRCAYLIYPPYFNKNLETGAFEGLNYDLIEAMGAQLDIDIEWVEEVPLDAIFSGLTSNRYDAACVGLWAIPSRAKVATFTKPFYYDGVYAFARTDDTRFDGGPSSINAEGVSIVVQEGELSQFIAEEDFSTATIITQPSLTGPSVRFMDIAAGKADVTFNEISVYLDYNENNPGTVQKIYDAPIRVGAAGFVIPKGEPDLKDMLDTTIEHMHNIGLVNKILHKHDPENALFLRVQKPYEVRE
jgi:polar amino acid transport system substrate-binding protein